MDNLLEQIKDFKKCVKSDNSDYLTGYLAALSAVEGMIEARRMNMSDNKVRLIDANIVIQKLKSYYNKLSPSIYSEIIRRDEVSLCIAELINAPTVEAEPVNTDKCKSLRNIEGIRLILSNVYNTGSTLQDCDYDAIYKRLDVIENILKGE